MKTGIQRLREYLGRKAGEPISQRAFARSIQRSSMSISVHESGRQPLGWKTLRHVLETYPKECRKLGITLESLMREKWAATNRSKRRRGVKRDEKHRGGASRNSR